MRLGLSAIFQPVIATPALPHRGSNRSLQLASAVRTVVCPTLALTLCVLSACARSEEIPDSTRPNIILVSLDTLRADRLSLYGNERTTSPFLDSIGEDSIVFERAIAQSSSTTPSHRSLFQSRIPSRTTKRVPMLAEILKDAGYATAAFTGGGNVSAKFGFGRGFDTYFEASKGQRSFAEAYPEFERWVRADREKPFFVFLHSYDIHHPYTAPEPYERMFCADTGSELDGRESGVVLNKIRRAQNQRDFTGEVVLTEADKRRITALYDGGIVHADTYLGKLRHLLDELGRWDDTILIVLSDHGEEFWEHGSVLHSHTLYQELLWVPLVIRLPDDRFGGRRIARPVRLLDVAPTLLDLLDLPVANSHQGTSLMHVVTSKEAGEPPVIVSEISALRSVLQWPWKVITERESGAMEMYHLDNDPGERRDLGVENRNAAIELYRQLTRGQPADPGRFVDVMDELPDDTQLEEQLRALGYIE